MLSSGWLFRRLFYSAPEGGSFAYEATTDTKANMRNTRTVPRKDSVRAGWHLGAGGERRHRHQQQHLRPLWINKKTRTLNKRPEQKDLKLFIQRQRAECIGRSVLFEFISHFARRQHCYRAGDKFKVQRRALCYLSARRRRGHFESVPHVGTLSRTSSGMSCEFSK